MNTVELSPPVEAWFRRRFSQPTEPQRLAWPTIANEEDTLVVAPTGSGKTLAAFLLILDRLVRRAMAGELEDRVEAVYISPLRALSHDIQRNLEVPLAEIREEAVRMGIELPLIRTAVRTGDTSPSERQKMLRKPPHIIVTTPESLFLLVTAEKSRNILRSARTLIVDEIHALARDKRGSHLAITIARLDALADRRPARIGLSATMRPVELLAEFLVGSDRPACHVVDLGHQRELDLAVTVPSLDELYAVAPAEQWDDLLNGIAELIQQHQTTLVFVNTRRLAERLTHQLQQKLGEDEVAAHHGSLSKERRFRVEERLKADQLKALVATASLELGIDIGSVDLVVQVGSPRGIATFLQRVGRSGHALGKVPKGRLYPTTRDELVECAALIRAVRAGRLDRVEPPVAPMDILAQQIVAACACEEWQEDELFALMRQASPFRELERSDYDAVVKMLAEGFETPRGRRAVYIHHDRLQKKLRAHRNARLAALSSGGAIPELGDYRVVLDPDDVTIGTVNEDWAIESMAGDIFLLGTHSWKIRRVEAGQVRVVDAQGAPPTIPFWLGEAPARTAELSAEVSSLRREVSERLDRSRENTLRWVEEECRLQREGSEQVVAYIDAQRKAVGMVPTCEDLMAERFFDEAGGMQLVIHSPHGARINRGLGLSIRKRFCRSFNMEIQAAASDDALVLSLGTAQTFPLDTLQSFLKSSTIEDTLSQALLDSPLFAARWRWNSNRSLAVLRMNHGKRVPFPIQRMQADDLLAAAFPDQVACQENVTFPIELPDHPLVRQTLKDSLTEACDVVRLRELLSKIEKGDVRLHVVDTVEASPFSHEILNAKPYAFLDDAPLEERRTRAVTLRHVLPDQAQDLARLDATAIARVREEAEPLVRDADELYEFLIDAIVLHPANLMSAAALADELVAQGRAAWVSGAGGRRLFAAERLAHVKALLPDAAIEPVLELPNHLQLDPVEFENALDTGVRGHMMNLGPATAENLSARIGVSSDEIAASLIRLESRGVLLSGSFDPALPPEQYCDRSLLARIHRYTIARLRREIEPVSAKTFLRFLLRWQHVHPDARALGERGLHGVIEQLSGFEAAAAAWEAEIFSARIDGYTAGMLDALCFQGLVAWGRLSTSSQEPSRVTPIAVFPRDDMESLLHSRDLTEPSLRGPAQKLLEQLSSRGALFAREFEIATQLLPVEVEDGLKELIASGLVTCDGFAPLRRLLVGGKARARYRESRYRRAARTSIGPEGRWGLLRPLGDPPQSDEQAERTAMRLLERYGVIFRDLLVREWIPERWREVHRALRRLEGRGVVRGGRFVTGFTGEQFAIPEAIPKLRAERKREEDGIEVRVSASDPLNLVGILTPGPRLAAGHTRYLIYKDGAPVAAIEKGQRVELPTESHAVGYGD